MAKHIFAPTRFYNAIGTAEPALVVADGDTVVASTLDAAGFDGEGVQRARGPNPMTGPVAVEGAEPGDALEVRIVRMTANRDEGWTYTPLAANVVEPAAVAKLPHPWATRIRVGSSPRPAPRSRQRPRLRVRTVGTGADGGPTPPRSATKRIA